MNVHDFSRGGIRAAPRSIALPSAVKHHARPARMCLARSSSPAVGQTDLKNVIERLMAGENLSGAESNAALQALVAGAEPAQMAAFLVLLRAKGETAEEIAGLANAMKALGVPVKTAYPVLDIVGTGGDGIGSVNISTGATVIAAAAGAKVAKHGSRSVSSLCGSADVLEALGISVDLGAAGVTKCVDEAGVGFMFAPNFHPAMKAISPVRKALKVRTAFNMLGPMLNPADAAYGLIGVYSTSISNLMADALQELGVKKALVVHSMGLDELTPMGPADVVEISKGIARRNYQIEPKDLGIPRCTVEDLAGGDAKLNAKILMDAFGGERGAVADALNLNAGVALAAANVAKDAKEGVMMAQEAQRSGKSADTMRKWIDVSAEAQKQGL